MELNIVDLIEKNPITKISQNCNGILVNKLKQTFNESQQQLFVASFYSYLNYDSKNDFVIDLDNIWKWIGFQQKTKAKILLEKYFKLDIDYKKSLSSAGKRCDSIKGGQNREIFMLNVKTFKSFCLKASTKKADEIHEYYLKLEELLQDVMSEESKELKEQLKQKNNELVEHKKTSELEKEELVEKTILDQFPINTQCIYYGKIDNKTLGKAPRLNTEDLIKFGQSNNLSERVKCHKKNFKNFRLIAAFKVQNKIEIENTIKRHSILKNRIRSLQIENANYEEENYRELLAIDNDKFTIEKIDGYIKDIIKEKQYNIENYNLLLDKNEKLEDELRQSEKEKISLINQIEGFKKELQNFTPDVTNYANGKIASNYSICKYGYYIYAFEYENLRYKCSITRQKDFEQLITNLKQLHPTGEMKYQVKISYPFSEKIMSFLMKQTATNLGNTKYECSYENLKKVIDVTKKLETLLLDNSKDIEMLSSLLDGTANVPENSVVYNDPSVPLIRKSKRSVDQIHIENGNVIATFESIEAAGRSLGLTTGTAIGIALREKRACKGFLWRYSGISKEDQYNDQPVVKICCSTGQRTFFKTIADAAKDCNISPPGIRARILTNVHINDHHWKFDKGATHYGE